jgi:hypothetical protein
MELFKQVLSNAEPTAEAPPEAAANTDGADGAKAKVRAKAKKV